MGTQTLQHKPISLASTGTEPNVFAATKQDITYVKNVINGNLLIILTICNIFSLGVCIIIIYNFLSAIASGKDERQKRKQRLYTNSAAFVFFIALLVIALLVTPFFPSIVWAGDIFMDFTVLLALLIWWS